MPPISFANAMSQEEAAAAALPAWVTSERPSRLPPEPSPASLAPAASPEPEVPLVQREPGEIEDDPELAGEQPHVDVRFQTPQEPVAEVNNFPAPTNSETPQEAVAEASSSAAQSPEAEAPAEFANLLPSTWDKADALGRLDDLDALREAAKHDTAQAQLEALERYHCAQTGEPYDDPEPPKPQPAEPAKQQVLPSFDDLMREAAGISVGDLPAVDQLLGQIADVGFTNAQQERLVAEIARCTGITKSTLKADLKESKKLVRAYRNPRLPASDIWKAKLIVGGENDEPKPIMANVALVAEEHPEFRGVLAINDFTSYVTLIAPAPWITVRDYRNEFKPRPITDDDILAATAWMQQNTGVHAPSHIVLEGIRAAANKAHFHPVRDYLDSLDWDGEERIDRLFTDYYGAKPQPDLTEQEAQRHTRYYRAVGSRFLMGAVARIYEPGCKLDTMPNLLGEQGAGKSSSLRILFGDEWFTDEISELGSKDAAMQAAGIWCIEISEMAAVRKSTAERVKAWLSRQADRFRPPYGKTIKEQPRQCVPVGTTNDDSFLIDETGNRRSWAVRCGEINLEALKRDRDQLWAEAAQRWRDGSIAAEMIANGSEHEDDKKAADAGKWWLWEPDLIAVAAEVQSEFLEQDVWHDAVLRYINGKDDVSIDEVLSGAIGKHEIADRTQADKNQVARILKVVGWTRKREQVNGERSWRYFRKSGPVGGDTGPHAGPR